MIYILFAVLNVCTLTGAATFWFWALNEGRYDMARGTTGWGLDVNNGIVWLISALLASLVVGYIMLCTYWLSPNRSGHERHGRWMPHLFMLFAFPALAFGFLFHIGNSCSYP